VTSIQPIKVSSEQGKILPLHVGASSKTLLAYQPDEIVDELFNRNLVKRYTANTITDKGLFKKHLEEIRNKGYSSSDEEMDEGVLAYGVPIRNREHEVIAALSVAGLRLRMLQKVEHEIVQQITAAVQEIEKYL
jgi:DNA-binding IclR family transcriptional regulator